MRLMFLPLFVFVLASCSSSNPAQDMEIAAHNLLHSFNEDQKVKAYADFSHKNRTSFEFFPDKFLKGDRKRFGLMLKEMNDEQKALTRKLLESALSKKGLITADNVILLEQILFDFTKDPIRATGLYYVSIFGHPSDHHTWGWSFEGHHLSINITLVNGQLTSNTPIFLGTNPGVVKKGKHKGLQVLADEENLAREIAKTLTPEQLKKANAMAKTPGEIYSGSLTKVNKSLFDPSKGLKYSEMTDSQKGKIKELINVHIEKFRPELLDKLDNSPLSEIDSLVFVWVGSMNPGEPHYYRLCTTNHLIEYDNSRNGGNHPHTAWREYDGDFGEDLIKKHYRDHHH